MNRYLFYTAQPAVLVISEGNTTTSVTSSKTSKELDVKGNTGKIEDIRVGKKIQIADASKF